MKLTLGKIAEVLQVSKATVSLVLNGKAKEKKVNNETANKILDYCKENNYVLNAHAKRMNSKLAKNIGLILYGGYDELPNPLSEYCTATISGGLTMEATKYGFCVTLLIIHKEVEIKALLQRFYSKEFDGFVSSNFPLWNSWYNEFRQNEIPVAIIGGDPQDELPTLNIDNFEMSYKMTEHVIKSNRKKIAFLAGGKQSYSGNERLRGFTAALKKNRIESAGLHRFNFNEKMSYNGVKDLIQSGEFTYDGLVCANDSMAVGAVNALQENGYHIHEDVMITGADKKDFLRYFKPHIPTYSMMPEEKGVAAFHLLKEQFDGKIEQSHIILASKLEMGE